MGYLDDKQSYCQDSYPILIGVIAGSAFTGLCYYGLSYLKSAISTTTQSSCSQYYYRAKEIEAVYRLTTDNDYDEEDSIEKSRNLTKSGDHGNDLVAFIAIKDFINNL